MLKRIILLATLWAMMCPGVALAQEQSAQKTSNTPDFYLSFGYAPIRISQEGENAYTVKNAEVEIGARFNNVMPSRHWRFNVGLKYTGPAYKSFKNGVHVSALGEDCKMAFRSISLGGEVGYRIPIYRKFKIEPIVGWWNRYNIQARLRSKVSDETEDTNMFDKGWRRFQILANAGVKLNLTEFFWVGADYNFNLIKLSKDTNESYFALRLGLTLSDPSRW